MDINNGTPCTVNLDGDNWMDHDARPFMVKPCIFLKITKGGLYQVALCEDTRKVYSFPKKNVVFGKVSGH